MQFFEFQEYWAAALIGQVLLSESVYPHLEVFSGNALYCCRGISAMKKYKTVKEVCDLTGLTRKHLYYFHHEKVVRAVAYANYSVEGNDGYKLYDDAAVEKLQQIALYYQLGLKRDEIRDIMLDPEYDSNRILDTLLSLERKKYEKALRHISALEYLKMTGTKHGINATLKGISLEELGQLLIHVTSPMAQTPQNFDVSVYHNNLFADNFIALIARLAQLESSALPGSEGDTLIGEIFALAKQNMGDAGVPFVLGLLLSIIGEGQLSQRLRDILLPCHANAIFQYILRHPELHTNHPDAIFRKMEDQT